MYDDYFASSIEDRSPTSKMAKAELTSPFNLSIRLA
jgi:hypothetical protein